MSRACASLHRRRGKARVARLRSEGAAARLRARASGASPGLGDPAFAPLSRASRRGTFFSVTIQHADVSSEMQTGGEAEGRLKHICFSHKA